MAKKHKFDYDLIIIGSGAGGSAAANIVASAGKKVAIIEADAFGGQSPNFCDIPIQATMQAAVLFDEAKNGSRFGLRSNTLGYNFPSIKQWKDLAVKRTGAGGNRHYYENQGIATFEGTARFISPNEITINRRHLSAESFLIASGSTWSIPEITGLDSVKYYTPQDILDITRPPKSLLVIGGGDSGVELAETMAVFGSKVYIAEKADRLLPHRDSEISEVIGRYLSNQKGISILDQSRVLSIEKDGLGKRAIISRAGNEKSLHVDEVLMCTGRKPMVDLGLENACVKYSSKGIETNEYLQTSTRHIFAAGDVLGRNNHTHTAILESRVAANNIINRNKITPDYKAMPEIVFTSPSIATAGLSEDDCMRRDLAINKAIAPLNIIARSNTADFRDGFVKLITDKKGVIIGGSVIAPCAGEIIHEIVLAIKYNLTATQLADTPHAFLSWSEAVRVAASKLA